MSRRTGGTQVAWLVDWWYYLLALLKPVLHSFDRDLTKCLPFTDTVVIVKGAAVTKTQFHLLGSCQVGAGRQTVNKTNHISWSGGLSPVGNSWKDLGRYGDMIWL